MITPAIMIYGKYSWIHALHARKVILSVGTVTPATNPEECLKQQPPLSHPEEMYLLSESPTCFL